MQIFRYEEDRLPVLILLSYFGLNLLVYFYVHNPWLLALWTLSGIIPKGWMSAWNHHHQHVMTFRQPILNRLIEIPYSLMCGITSHAWVLHHVVGHHLNYMDQTKDESRWKHLDGRTMGEIEYTFVTSFTAYWRCIQVGLRHPRHFRVFVGMGLLILAILGAFFYYNWVGALFVWLLPMIISVHMVVWATYDHHAGLESRDHFQSSYNVLDKWYNLATLNLGYHTAHHYRQAIHWSKLPALHAEIEPKIPPHLYKSAGVPFSWVYALRARLTGVQPLPPAPVLNAAAVVPESAMERAAELASDLASELASELSGTNPSHAGG